jgi:hypothetical protein
MPMTTSNPSSQEAAARFGAQATALSELNQLIKESEAQAQAQAGFVRSAAAYAPAFPEPASATREADYDLQHVVDVAMATTQPEPSFRTRHELAPLTPAILSQWLIRPQWRSSRLPGPVTPRPTLTPEELDSLKIHNSPTPCLRPLVKLEAGRPSPFPEIPEPALGPVLPQIPRPPTSNTLAPLQVSAKEIQFLNPPSSQAGSSCF